MVAIAEALCHETVLSTLQLKVSKVSSHPEESSRQVGVKGAKAIAEALKLNTSLRTFGFQGNAAIGEQGVTAICSALSVNTTLTHLDLSSIPISPLAAQQVIDTLATSSLSSITLANCKLPSETVLRVFQAATFNLSLQRIDFGDARLQFSSKQFARLQRVIANSKLIYAGILHSFTEDKQTTLQVMLLKPLSFLIICELIFRFG